MKRMNNELTTIVAYRGDLREKRQFIENAIVDCPKLAAVIDPVRDVHQNSMREIKLFIRHFLEGIRHENAATFI